jgi:hypothetical protein
MNNIGHYIPRHLSYWSEDGKEKRIAEDSLTGLLTPLIILGEPGMGKTELLHSLGRKSGMQFVRATTYLRQADAAIPPDVRLVIDGLDEVAAAEEGDPLHNVLRKLVRCGRPLFVLSCRSAEWRQGTAKDDVLDDYGIRPLVLRLDPLTRDEAMASLAQVGDHSKADMALSALEDAGLGDMYRNPLLLKFIAAILVNDDLIPGSRAELFKMAVRQLRLEHNARLTGTMLAKLSENRALDAAGAAMAVLLITGKDAIVKTLSEGGSTVLPVAELSDLAETDDIVAILGSNLFKPEDGSIGRFVPLHRTVAEYLGARWLARHVDKSNHRSRVMSRLLGLISDAGGIPASLRGLHAWLPYFSPTVLGPSAIATDPYGVLRYGDTDALSVFQARQLLIALRALSLQDPYFRSDHWQRFSIKGLMQPELYPEIQQLLVNPDTSVHLRSLLLESLRGSELTQRLREDLVQMVRSTTYVFRERATAGEALAAWKASGVDWSRLIRELMALGDEDSLRLAVELLIDVGFDQFDDQIIADAVVTHTGILSSTYDKDRHRIAGVFLELGARLPNPRLGGVLDALTSRILPTRTPRTWWDDSRWEARHEISNLAGRLIVRQLEHDPASVSAKRLWDWLRALERADGYESQEREKIALRLEKDVLLRRDIQRLAFFGDQSEDDRGLIAYHLARLNTGLRMQADDARELLAEISRRHDDADRERWKMLVNQLRSNDGVDSDTLKVARAYAERDAELIEFLYAKPKSIVEDWEKKLRRNERERKQRERKALDKTRQQFFDSIDDVRRGELRWIVGPAKAYIGMFSDLDSNVPSERVSDWLGQEIGEAALVGFEAVLRRNDLPTARQIAESYAESRVWNFVYPMLAGANERLLKNGKLGELSQELVSALAIAADHELLDQRKGMEGLREALYDELRLDHDFYEQHLRQRFEPHFRKGGGHTTGLYSFARSANEQPLFTKLALEWLSGLPDISAEDERELVNCVLDNLSAERDGSWKKLNNIAVRKLQRHLSDGARTAFWRSLQFLLDFETAIAAIPRITTENRDWLWSLTKWFSDRDGHNAQRPVAETRQLAWIVRTFRKVWPVVGMPRGTWGSENPWDATRRIQWAIGRLAADPSDSASNALADLREMPIDDYTDEIQAAIASQRKVRLEVNFQSPSLEHLRAALKEEPPMTAADVQAIVLDELKELQGRLRGSALNPVNNFYDEKDRPKTENECRDQMLIALGKLPYGIQMPPETAMPQGNRSDGAFTYGGIAVPLEAKGQWHKDVWTAAATQLDRYYAIEHRAASKGIFVVFWFGPDVPPGKRLKLPPSGKTKPENATTMQVMLSELLPSSRRGDIAIIVLDLSRDNAFDGRR